MPDSSSDKPKKPRKVSKDVNVPIPVVGAQSTRGDDRMLTISGGTLDTNGASTADVPANIHQQTLSRLSSAGASAHEHFITYGKILDFAYEADRKMVSLVQSLGVREVTSQSGQLGIPNAAQQGSAAGKVG